MTKRIAIVGSGQLAQMMAQEGIPMGLQFSFLVDTGEDTCCVDNLGELVVRGTGMSARDIYQKLHQPDVITVEKEYVDIDLLTRLQKYCPVHPNPNALEKFKNRRVEKLFLQSLDIPIAPFVRVQSDKDLREACANFAKPVFVKSEEQGYDGYNQYKVTDETLEEVLASIDFNGQWVAESFVPFEREVSFIAARDVHGNIVFYPPVENYHRDGTLLTSLAPAPELSRNLQDLGQQYLKKVVMTLDYVGVICMECFVWGDKLLANEIAPRVHNSGHWTLKGALTSQFENHVRAVAGLALGPTQAHCVSGMLNLLGVTLTAEQTCKENGFLTLYGKAPRPRRKLGHVTVLGSDYENIKAQLISLKKLAYPD